MVLAQLPGPFFAWLGTLIFLLLMQFLIRYLKELVGKGLPMDAIVELVLLNMAYILVLAVPMSMLIATLMTFGRLADTQAYAAARSAGISLFALAWPVFAVALLVTAALAWFNSLVLPEANFRARTLWQDIRRQQPGFLLEPGVFYTGLSGYAIQAQEVRRGALYDVLIYDQSEGVENRRILRAERGELRSLPGDQVELSLIAGSMDRYYALPAELVDRYERVQFERFSMRLDLSQFRFNRTETEGGFRSDRTTPVPEMWQWVDSLRQSQTGHRVRVQTTLGDLLRVPPNTLSTVGASAPSRPDSLLAGIEESAHALMYTSALDLARVHRVEVDNAASSITWDERRARRFEVEIHKKFSLAAACLLFALVGVPLGVRVRRGGLAMSGALAIGLFLSYWVMLVLGEKFSDQGFIAPWFAMWWPNFLLGVLALWLLFPSRLLPARFQ